MAKILNISTDSVVKRKLKAGDEILKFNGRVFSDILDYVYAESMDEGVIEAKRGDKVFTVKYRKEEDDTLGLDFDRSVEITPIECHNNCIFCFVKQLPKGLRETLYIKDDDYRLSFISGSYITCTNLTESDMQRIIDYKLSPLYVSVHATDEAVRKFMLGVKKAPNQTEQLKRFIEAGIIIHAQIVLVGGVNDGDVLSKSLTDLYDVGARTVAVVPVGLTEHRDDLYDIKPLSKEQAAAAIDICEEFYAKHQSFCYCSDEMYQIAEREIRGEEYYGAYEQIENGVGLIPKFLGELSFALEYAPSIVKQRTVGVITGVSGVSTMQKAKQMVEKKYPNVKINIYPVVNNFFGKTVTVTGLVTAGDIYSQYKDKAFTEDYLMLPSVMLREFEDVFLDNVSLERLKEMLNKKIVVSHPTGDGFLDGIIYGE